MRPSQDIELSAFRPKEDSRAQGSVASTHRPSGYSHDELGGRRRPPRSGTPPLRRFIDSFKRDPDRHVTPASVINPVASHHRRASDASPPLGNVPTREYQGAHYFDLHAANVNTANTQLSRELKGRHLQMIAIGGSIGTYSLACFLCEHLGTYRTAANMIAMSRYWAIRSLRKGAQYWWSSLPHHRLLFRRRHAVLHHASPGRARRDFSRCRFLFGLLNSLSRPSMGVCYGLEVSCP